MSDDGLVCLYHNSGAFGFAPNVTTQSVGWIGQADRTIRPEALAMARPIAGPIEATLASMAVRAWLDNIGGRIRVTPKSHWAYELDFGSHNWMPAALLSAGVSQEQLRVVSRRHDGSAFEFELSESPLLRGLLDALLSHLLGSDFQLTWPGRPIICTVHHHKQLWWTTSDAALKAALKGRAPEI